MKIKQLTTLKHKLQWLLLLAALFGVNQGVWAGAYGKGWSIKFKCGSWSTTATTNSTQNIGVINTSSSNPLKIDEWHSYWNKNDGNLHDSGGLKWSFESTSSFNWNGKTGTDWNENSNICHYATDCNTTVYNGSTPGLHWMKVYFEANDNGSTIYLNNSGSNYTIDFTVPGYTSSTGDNYGFSSTVVGSSRSSGSLSTSDHYGDDDGASISSTNTTDFTATKTDADTYSVTFNPKSTGSKSTTITITDKYGKTYQRTFTGTGTAIGDPSNATLSFSGSTATIGWERNSPTYKKVMVVRYESPNLTPTTPSNGTSYTAGSSTIGNGRVIYNGNCESASSSITNTITPGKTYVYYIYTNNGNCYSSGINTGSVCCPPLDGFTVKAKFNDSDSDPWEGSEGTSGSSAATGGVFSDDHRDAKLSTTQVANYYQWYGCDADGSNPTTTPANVTFTNSNTNTCTAQFELPGTYYFLCKAGCSSADVASSVVQVDVPYPEFGISGPFFSGAWEHQKAGTDGLFTHKEGTNIWTKTFNCSNPTDAFVIIQQYKKGATCKSGWVGDNECTTGKNNKMNSGTITLTGISQSSPSADFYKDIACMPKGSSVTITLTMTAHDTYDISMAKTKSAPSDIYMIGKLYDDTWSNWSSAFEKSDDGNVFTLNHTAKVGSDDPREFVLSTTSGDYGGKINICMDSKREGWEYENDADHTSNLRATSTVVPSNNTPITIKVMYNVESDDFTMVITKQCSALNTAHASTSLLLDEYSENVLCPGEKAKATMVSRKGYTYELFNGATSLGSNAGNGTTLSWKNLSDAGTYYVMATKSDDATCTGIVGTASQTINSSTVSVTASPGTSVVDFRPITLSKSAESTVDGDLTWAITAGSNGYLLLLSSKLPYDDRQRESVIFKGGPYGDSSRDYTITATGKKTVNIGATEDKKTCESTATVNITLTAVPGCN